MRSFQGALECLRALVETKLWDYCIVWKSRDDSSSRYVFDFMKMVCFNFNGGLLFVGSFIGLVAAVAVEFPTPAGKRKPERRSQLLFVRTLDFDILEGQMLAKHLLSSLLQYH